MWPWTSSYLELVMNVTVRAYLARSESTLLRALTGLSALDWGADLRDRSRRLACLAAASSLSNKGLLVGEVAGSPASCGEAAGAAVIGVAAIGVATAGGPAGDAAAWAA